MFHEHPSKAFWALSLLGAVLVMIYSITRSEHFTLDWGDLLLLGSALCASTGYVYSVKLTKVMKGWEVISWAMILALPFAALACFILWPTSSKTITSDMWSALLYLGLFSQYFSFFAWNKGLAMGGVARVSQVQLFQTFVTIALAALINDEHIDLQTWGFAAIIVGLIFLSRKLNSNTSQ
jgi:drug/metabolite transporter (DMT)-like permease